jgi:hypothetical protein
MGFDALVVPSKSISTNAQYVTLDDTIKCLSLAVFQYVPWHWKSWMRFISQIQQIHWKIARALEKTIAFRALEKSVINTVKSYLGTAPCF